ncbi:MAG: transcriptional repressor [Chloroflexota bacterium]|nr:transcriptional repressor [Chloroflexota bacterium]
MVQDQVVIVNSIIDLIESSGNSVTNSRRRIIAEIVRKDGLFTSEEITKDLPNIGRATVYRTIKLLYELEKICRINIVDDHSYYALSSSDHHHHTICKKCNKIEEINITGLEKSIRKYEKDFNGELVSHNLEIYIICQDCN